MPEFESATSTRTSEEMRDNAFLIYRKNLRLLLPIALLIVVLEQLIPRLFTLLPEVPQNILPLVWGVLISPIILVGLFGVCHALLHGGTPHFSDLFAYCRNFGTTAQIWLASVLTQLIPFLFTLGFTFVWMMLCSGISSLGGYLFVVGTPMVLVFLFGLWFWARTFLIPYFFVTGRDANGFHNFKASFTLMKGHTKQFLLFWLRLVIFWGIAFFFLSIEASFLAELIFASGAELLSSVVRAVFLTLPLALLTPYFVLAEISYIETLFPPEAPGALPETLADEPEAF